MSPLGPVADQERAWCSPAYKHLLRHVLGSSRFNSYGGFGDCGVFTRWGFYALPKASAMMPQCRETYLERGRLGLLKVTMVP